MSAGGSDYSAVAQGGLGQGFAQGVQQGTDNYNKGVDRKAAQANTYLTQFIGPNMTKLSTPIPRPPAGSDPQEFADWQRAEEARLAQLDLLGSQSEKYLKVTGSPLSKDEWVNLFYDPTSAVSAAERAKRGQDITQYGTLASQAKAYQQRLMELDPASPGYAQVLGQYEKFKAESNFAAIYKSVNNAEYEEVVGSTKFIEAVRQGKVAKNDETALLGFTKSNNPEIAAKASQLIASGTMLDALDPATGETYRKGFNAAMDAEGLDNYILTGDKAQIGAALQRILVMDDDKRAALSPAATKLWNDYQTYISGGDLPEGPNKQAFDSYKIVGQEVTKNTNSIQLQGLTYTLTQEQIEGAKKNNQLLGINISTTQRENLWKFGALAQDGNKAVTASKAEFMGMLPEAMPQAEKDALWASIVEQPILQYEAVQTKNMANLDAQLVGMTASTLKSQNDYLNSSIEQGLFHLTGVFKTDANGEVTIDKTSAIYKNLEKIGANVNDETLLAQYVMSKQNLAALGDKKRLDAEMGATNLAIGKETLAQQKVVTKWADIFSTQKWTANNYANVIAAAQAEVAPAQARGELALLMSTIVEKNGVAVMDDPEFKKMFGEALGSEAAYNSARGYLAAEAKYRLAVQTNTLTSQGQQITAANNDEFDRMFKSPEAIRMYLDDPNKVAEIARAAGIDPDTAIGVLTQLKNENRAMTDLNIRQIRFSMYAQQQNIDLGVRSANLADRRFVFDQTQTAEENRFREKVYANDNKWREIDNRFREGRATQSDMQWLAGYNQGVHEFDVTREDRNSQWAQEFGFSQDQADISNGFRVNEQNFQINQWRDMRTFRDKSYNDGVVQQAMEFAYKMKQDGLSNGMMNRQINSLYLTPLAGKIGIVEGQIQAANADLQALYKANPKLDLFAATGIKWVGKTDKNGNVYYEAEVADPTNASAVESFNRYTSQGVMKQLTAEYNRGQVLGAELNAAKGVYTELIDKFAGAINGEVTPAPPAPQGQLTAATGKTTPANFKSYQTTAPTKFGSDLAAAWNSAVTGGLSKTYPNIATEKYCTTAIQAALGQATNIPGGMPTGGDAGANGFMAGLIGRGATTYSGSGPGGAIGVNDLANLPDGTLLFQKDGTTMGHVGMLLGGQVVQNSLYKDTKLNGAIGVMDPTAYVTAKGTTTIAVMIPDAWKKSGGGANPAAPAAATPVKPGTTTAPGKNTPAAAPAAATRSKFTTSEGNFAPDLPGIATMLSKRLTPTGGVSIKTNAASGAGLRLKLGTDRYAEMSNPTVATAVVRQIGTQFGNHFLRQYGGSFGEALKENRPKAKANFIKELQNAGLSGDLNRYADEFFKYKGW